MRSIEDRPTAPALAPTRRGVVRGAVALGLSGAFPGAGLAADTPVKGGRLRVGLGGGSTTDQLDPTTYTDSVMLFTGFALYNTLIENGPDNKPIPELAESWEAKPGASEWIFNLRKGVTFSNGQTFGPADAIYSLNRHRGASKSGNAAAMKAVTRLRQTGPSQIEVALAAPDADFPYVLSDFHMLMVPEGFEDFARPVGTGAFELAGFEPGVKIGLRRRRDYWKPDRGLLEAVDVTVINEAAARMNALVSDQVDAINRADPKTIALLKKSPNLEIVQAAGGWFPILSMFCDTEPFSNPDLRTALKYGIDRPQALRTLFAGYGSLGNDHPIPRSDPFFNMQLPQTTYDPDKAKAFLQKAGLANTKLTLSASDAAFNGAIDLATLFQTSAAKAGITIEIKKEPIDGFWTNVWLKAPFCTSYWAGRPTATEMLAVAFSAQAPWNDTHWRVPAFENLLAQARGELDETKRRALVWDMQAMLHADGGATIPVFRDFLDAHANKVGGHTPHLGFDMDNGRFAEKAWVRT